MHAEKPVGTSPHTCGAVHPAPNVYSPLHVSPWVAPVDGLFTVAVGAHVPPLAGGGVASTHGSTFNVAPLQLPPLAG
jgi:hypothetical protein